MTSETDTRSQTQENLSPGGEKTFLHVNDSSRSGRGTKRYGDSFAGGQSIRLHPRSPRGGLAMRLAIPIIIPLLIALVIAGLYIRSRVFSLQLATLKSDAANTAFTTGMLGRLLLTHRDKFLEEHPDYLTLSEWRAGDHWLVAHGFVSEEDWVKATGFGLDEYAPAAVMERAGEKTILSDMTRWIDSFSNHTELVAVYLQNANGTTFAASVRPSPRFDPLALKSIPPSADFLDIGGTRISVDYLGDFKPEPVVRAIAQIMSANDLNRELGRAIVVYRTQRYNRGQHSFLAMTLVMTALLGAFMSLVCWFAARRVTGPMRQLADAMEAVAEGDYSRSSGIQGADEIGKLAQAFDSMAERLRVAWATAKENSRLESDLDIARGIQNNLLPPQTPRVRGLDIYTTYKPAREIGGDYFDFLPVDSQHMGIVVADASGKSIPAALVMSTTRAILRFVAPGSASAAETLTRVNAILSVDIPKGMFVTAFYLIFDPVNRTMLCASAGHTPLLLARTNGEVEQINPGGIALCFDAGPIFQRSIREQEVPVEPGDRVLLYTDGVVECVNPANEEYSDRRLREFLRRNRELSSSDFVGALMADLDRHRGAADMRDDTTIVTFKIL